MSDRLPPNILSLAAALHKAGQWQQAQTMYEQVLQIEPHNPKALNYLGVLKSQLGDRTGAINLIQQAVALEPQSWGYLNNLGNVYRAAQELDLAIATYEQAIALNPNFADSHFNLGIAYTEKGLSLEAIAAFEQTIAINPDHNRVHLTLGNLRQARGDLDLATAHYMKSLTLQPDSLEALAGLGMVFYLKGDLKRSQQAYERALALNPFSTEVLINLGANFYEQGKPEIAAACYREVINIAPHSTEAYCNLGMLLGQQGQDQAAIAYYDQALQLNANDPKALTGVADIYGKRSQWPKVIELYSHLIQLHPQNAEFYVNLGIAQRELAKGELLDNHDNNQSIANFEKAIALDPTQIKAYAHLGLALDQRSSSPNWIFDYQRFVQTYQIQQIEGWPSLTSFNDSLKTYIYEHPTLVANRLGKPLHKGKQTYEIFKDHHKAIASLRHVIQAHLHNYLQHCQGQSQNQTEDQTPIQNQSNPFFQNLTPHGKLSWQLSGWAVVLEPQGFQDAHIHPESFCSGVYYIQIPSQIPDQIPNPQQDNNQGHLRFGLEDSRFTIQPEPGLLVLFPSYMWHSTIPFTAPCDRICISFNITANCDQLCHS